MNGLVGSGNDVDDYRSLHGSLVHESPCRESDVAIERESDAMITVYGRRCRGIGQGISYTVT